MNKINLLLMCILLCGCKDPLFKKIGENKYELKKSITYKSLQLKEGEGWTNWSLTFEKGGTITIGGEDESN